MKIAVISDIHANFEAFREVLSDIERSGAESVVCLGDCIGYGPDPEEVAVLVRSMGIPTVMGNHERGIAQPESLTWFNPSARRSIMLTDELISETTRQWTGQLEASLAFQDALLVHGCPPNSISTYLFEVNDSKLGQIFAKMEQRICFVGHTHTLELVSWKEDRVVRSELRKGILRLDANTRHIVNVGSVGQPRDGNRNAKYVIWDNSEDTLEVRFVAYDAVKTAQKIIRLGFPQINADRLL